MRPISAGRIRFFFFFFEEEAFDEHGRLARPKECSINKVGHALHDLDRCSTASRAGRR